MTISQPINYLTGSQDPLKHIKPLQQKSLQQKLHNTNQSKKQTSNLTSSWKKKVGKIGRAQLREDSHLKQHLYFTWQITASFDTWDNDRVNWDNDGVNGAYVITMIIREIIYEII